MTKILTLAASFRPDSLNRTLLTLAADIAADAGAELTAFDYRQVDMPLYRAEIGDKLPAGAQAFADALLQSDGLLLASPEYNWSIPGGLKNLIDWVSTDARATFKNRGALLLCASPSMRGGILGLNQLSLPLAHLGMHVYPHLIAIGDAENQLGNGASLTSKDRLFLTECVTDFVRVTGARAAIHSRS